MGRPALGGALRPAALRAGLRALLPNLRAGVTVSLVSIPLSISLALASGAGPTEGVITAAWGGLLSAALGGCQFNIFGATGALAGIHSRFAAAYGPGVQSLLPLLAGGWCLALGGLRLHTAIDLVPGHAMMGFGLAISVILVLSQLNFILGLPRAALAQRGSTLGNLGETLTHLHLTSWGAVLTFALAFSVNVAAARRYPRLPVPMLLAGAGIALGAALELGAGADTSGGGGPPALSGFTVQTLGGVYGDLGRAIVRPPAFLTGGGLPPAAWAPTTPAGAAFWGDVLGGSASVAVIALLETLISTRMCDGLTGSTSSEGREVFGCGVANAVTGLAGGLGTNAALARTLLNIDAGATSRASGVVNGCATLLLCTALFPYFRYLPLPVVAAVLVTVSVRMVSLRAWAALGRSDPGAAAIGGLVTVVSVVADPAVGVAAGTLATVLRHMWVLRRGPASVRLAMRVGGEGGGETPPSCGAAADAACPPAGWAWVGEQARFDGRTARRCPACGCAAGGAGGAPPQRRRTPRLRWPLAPACATPWSALRGRLPGAHLATAPHRAHLSRPPSSCWQQQQ